MIDENKTGYIQFEELKAAKQKYGSASHLEPAIIS